MSRNLLLFVSLYIVIFSNFGCRENSKQKEKDFVVYRLDMQSQNIQFYWKDNAGKILGSIQNLISFLDSQQKTLLFAVNGGMFKPDRSPQGLFIQNGVTISPLDTFAGTGNFYLKPNGIFYIKSDGSGGIYETNQFSEQTQIRFATQSGPMLIINKKIHPAFREDSKSLNIRNGVGVKGRSLIFVMSKKEINFYNFAKYFQSLGCEEALYLDGFVSRTYLPEENSEQLDGDFGVIIGVTKK